METIKEMDIKNTSLFVAFFIGCCFIYIGIEQTQYAALSSGERDYVSGFIGLCVATLITLITGAIFMQVFRYLKVRDTYALYISEGVFVFICATYAFSVMVA